VLSRRKAVTGAGAVFLAPLIAKAASVNLSFDELLEKALENPEVLEATRQEREGLAAEFDYFATRALAPRYSPSSRKISDDAIKLIVAFEVTGKERYERLYCQPVWPRGKSGVTIGIGYDVGYTTKAWFHEDWSGILTEEELSIMDKACGVHGEPASELIFGLSSIHVDWDAAYKQFTTTSLPRFTAETLAVLPNADKLPADCLGVLVSLVYNRGASFKFIGDKYVEMRSIKLDMVNENYNLIPGEFRGRTRYTPHP
jgi:hypothetical protein